MAKTSSKYGARGKVKPNAELRQSQLLTTYGPGSLVDLPKHAVIIGGLDSWKFTRVPEVIIEDRLLSYLRRHDDFADVELRSPPTAEGRNDQDFGGVTAYQFPQWFIVQAPETWGDNVRSRRLVHISELQNGKARINGKSFSVTPMRFVRACVNGHISDIDWPALVHREGPPCYGQLVLDERNTSGDLSGSAVRCSACKQSINLSTLADRRLGASLLGPCGGEMPWLNAVDPKPCVDDRGAPTKSRFLNRSASNAYFPQLVRVISIPDDEVSPARQLVEQHWSALLVNLTNRAMFEMMFNIPDFAAKLQGVERDLIWAEIERRHALGQEDADVEEALTLKQSELRTLLNQPPEQDEQPALDSKFFARTLIDRPASSGPMSYIERVVLVHKLREVSAQIGFTRFESGVTDIEGELDLNVQRAPLASLYDWLPAVENHGEGIFLALDKAKVQAWMERPAVIERAAELSEAFDKWRQQRKNTRDLEFPGLPYIMLHSLSHLLLTAVSLECGYSASSIRERIYASQEGYGVLLYTGTSDSEGTLGGLVEVGRHLELHLRAALSLGQLCSNDPVCAQHDPLDEHIDRHLHGAACHGCLLISETSCERRNELLDRALVVPTVAHPDYAFFEQV